MPPSLGTAAVLCIGGILEGEWLWKMGLMMLLALIPLMAYYVVNTENLVTYVVCHSPIFST